MGRQSMINGIRVFAATVCCALMVAGSGAAEAGSIVRTGFEMPKDRELKIVVFRPDVQVGTMRTTVEEPNAEWTDTAPLSRP